MTAQPGLVERARQALQDHNPREVTMFGGVSFMVGSRLIAAARRDGTLLLRIDPEAAPDLLNRPGAHPAFMGADRPMGRGWISIDAEALNGPELDAWLAHALSFPAAQAPNRRNS